MPTLGQFHSTRPIFNAFADAAPDRWGQNLLRRQERQRAKAAGGPPRTLFAGDLLLGVDDGGRHGAFRFKTKESDTFLANNQRPIPPIVALAKLQSAAARFVRDRETDSDLALLLGPGTSLGGARPKATVQQILAEVVTALAHWPTAAAAAGLKRAAIERMESAFEHEDAVAARRLVGGLVG